MSLNAEVGQVVIYHHPQCSKSRQVLEMILEAGHTPEVILYLETGWQAESLTRLLARAQLSPQQVLREDHPTTQAHDLLDEHTPSELVIAYMVKDPSLVNRPLVETARGVRLCRPIERVFEIL